MKQPIALVAAMREELDALLACYPAHEARLHFNTPLYHARDGGQEIVIAQSGVGKANAASTLTLLLSDFSPGCVVNTGCAGGLQREQRIRDLVVPEEIVYTDVDVRRLKFIKRLKVLGLSLSEMQELEDIWSMEKKNERVLKRLLEILDSHLNRLDERLTDLNILRNEILDYRGRIRAKTGAG